MKEHACGKVILLGEHAVVYGTPALAVGIERGAWAEATPVETGLACTLSVPAWNLSASEAGESTESSLGGAFASLVRVCRAEGALASPLAVVAGAALPPGGGLGCSAALGVAVARALDPGADTSRIAARVMAWESVFHGNPSGIDAAVAARGGSIYFEKGQPIEPVPLGSPLVLCVGMTGIASSTKAMVEAVARLRASRPETADKIFEGIRSLVRNARLALEAGDVTGLGRLMDLNQMLLAGLFVSTTEIEAMCSIARAAGALGAKLTGAGGGGCVVALATAETSEAVLGAWESAGFAGFVARVGASRSSRPLAVAPLHEVSEAAESAP